jgi:hypothetical protein
MRILRMLFLVVMTLAGWLVPTQAQAVTYDLPCSAGSTDLLSPTYNPLTGNLRSWVCVNATGTVTSPVFQLASAAAYTSYQSALGGVTAVSGTDVTLYTVNVPGGTFGAAHGLNITYCFNHTGGSTSTVYKIFYGATSVTLMTTGAASQVICGTAVLANNVGVTNAQQLVAIGSFNGAVGTFGSALATPAEDSTATKVLKLTFNIANNSDVVTPQMFEVVAF